MPQIKESLWRKFVDANIETMRWLVESVGELLLFLVVLTIVGLLMVFLVICAFALISDVILFVAGIVLTIQSLTNYGLTSQAEILAMETLITVPVFFVLAYICRKGFGEL